jgi:hypothetical protein
MERLESMVVNGSLVNGDFVPDFSDLDLVTIVQEGTLDSHACKTYSSLILDLRQQDPDCSGRLH